MDNNKTTTSSHLAPRLFVGFISIREYHLPVGGSVFHFLRHNHHISYCVLSVQLSLTVSHWSLWLLFYFFFV